MSHESHRAVVQSLIVTLASDGGVAAVMCGDRVVCLVRKF